jgi:hypothetical protein
LLFAEWKQYSMIPWGCPFLNIPSLSNIRSWSQAFYPLISCR